MQGAHAFCFLLNIQHISNIREVDVQIIININLDYGIKGILDGKHISLKVVDCHRFAARIYNPIFTDSIIFVVVEFANIIICWVTGRYNFNNKIWCTVATNVKPNSYTPPRASAILESSSVEKSSLLSFG